MAPRTEWGCQPVAFAASAMVAPSFRRRRSTSRACLESARGTAGDGFLVVVWAALALFVLVPLRRRPADCFERREVMLALDSLCSSAGTPIAARPASVMTRIRRWPSLLSRHAAALLPAACSASRPLFSRLFRTWLVAPPWSLTDFGSGNAAL